HDWVRERACEAGRRKSTWFEFGGGDGTEVACVEWNVFCLRPQRKRTFAGESNTAPAGGRKRSTCPFASNHRWCAGLEGGGQGGCQLLGGARQVRHRGE